MHLTYPGTIGLNLVLEGPEAATPLSTSIPEQLLLTAKKLSITEVRQLIVANNKSAFDGVTTNLLIALIWKESSFVPDVKQPDPNTATGLMQITKDAVEDVNNNTPQGSILTIQR